jgi:hypothetical protein
MLMKQEPLSTLISRTMVRKLRPHYPQATPNLLLANRDKKLAATLEYTEVPHRIAKVIAIRSTKIILHLIIKAKASRAANHKGWMCHGIANIARGVGRVWDSQRAQIRPWAGVVLIRARIVVTAVTVMVPTTAPHRHITTRITFENRMQMAMRHASTIVFSRLGCPFTPLTTILLFSCRLLHQGCAFNAACAIWIIAITTHKYCHDCLRFRPDFLLSRIMAQLLVQVGNQAIFAEPVHGNVRHPFPQRAVFCHFLAQLGM